MSPSILKMSSSIFLTFALFLSVSMNTALPSDLQKLSRATKDVDSLTSKSTITTPNLLTAQSVTCLEARRKSPTLIPSDCSYLLSQIILQHPNVSKQRMFKPLSYMTDAGKYARSLWWHGNCELSVYGHKHASQLLTFSEIALTANTILSKCIKDVFSPKGGVSLIGDVSAGFHVILQGYDRLGSIAAKNTSVAQQPAVSMSRRGSISPQFSEDSGGPRAVAIRDPLRGVSRVGNHLAVTSNFTMDTARPGRYPVHCFNPFVIHQQPAAAADCNYVINQIILRLFEPTRQLTFGFTDAADIDLSKPEYQRWQYGQCVISVKNNDVAQVDTFRLLDLAITARRISTQCLVNTQEKLGGVATIGTDGRGFYVYVGGPFFSSPALSDVILSNESTGVESF